MTRTQNQSVNICFVPCLLFTANSYILPLGIIVFLLLLYLVYLERVDRI